MIRSGTSITPFPCSLTVLVPVCSPSLLQSGLRLEHPADLLAYRLAEHDWKPISRAATDLARVVRSVGVSCGQLDDAFVFSLSSLAIEAAIDGRGIALAQQSMILEDVKAAASSRHFITD